MNQSDNERKEVQTQDADKNLAQRRDAYYALEELLGCAEELERTSRPSADSEKWFSDQSESLLRWAKETGRFLSTAEFADLTSGFKVLDGGLEHLVFYKRKEGRVFKVTKPPYFGLNWELKGYVQNLILCNWFFEDDIRNRRCGSDGARCFVSDFPALHYWEDVH